ncbi:MULTISPECIES: HAD family hydrolase [Mycetocola]|uniref:HAD family hydrolase n=1 Tax=Mycetocola TaxID=76634 RepID=UPI00165D1D55|nr:HAD family hydrolase [Mycetocola sp. JXN-3]
MIQLAVFDFSGTTIDDGQAVYRALEDAVRECGVGVDPHDLLAWMSADKHTALAALIELGGGSVTASVVARAHARYVALLDGYYVSLPPRPLPGVSATLRALRAAGIRIALTTGLSRPVATAVLARLGWRLGAPGEDNAVTIDALVCGDEVSQLSPAPYLIHRAMERTGVLDAARVLSAGDTVADVQAGLYAGAAHALGILGGEHTAADFREAGLGPATDSRVRILDAITVLPEFLNLSATPGLAAPAGARTDASSPAAPHRGLRAVDTRR